MSSFTTPADLRMMENYRWQLLSEFDYYVSDALWSKHKPCPANVRVPLGTVTDLASVPRALWVVFPPHGEYAKAAIIHDYLYDQAIGTKEYADAVFLEAMEVLEVSKMRRTVMYWAVRWFGKGKYK